MGIKPGSPRGVLQNPPRGLVLCPCVCALGTDFVSAVPNGHNAMRKLREKLISQGPAKTANISKAVRSPRSLCEIICPGAVPRFVSVYPYDTLRLEVPNNQFSGQTNKGSACKCVTGSHCR